jgi:hypothetical protein
MPTIAGRQYQGRMPLSIKLRWWLVGFLEEQIQTIITERLLMYRRVNSAADGTEQQGRALPPREQPDLSEARRTSHRLRDAVLPHSIS